MPVNSVIIVAANTNQQSWGSATVFTNANGEIIRESLFVRAFSDCLNDPTADTNGDGVVDEAKAFDCMKRNQPDYHWAGEGKRYYLAGPPEGETGANPDPQKREVGRNPFATALTISNITGTQKTDFHIVYQGNLTNGLSGRSTRALPDGTPFPGLGWTNPPRFTYDPETDQTTANWETLEQAVQALWNVTGRARAKTA